MALKWINLNIKVFYGDPKNVTLFGGSSGGACVHYLMLSPIVKGEFLFVYYYWTSLISIPLRFVSQSYLARWFRTEFLGQRR